MDITQIVCTDAYAGTANVKSASANLVSQAGSTQFADYLTGGNSADTAYAKTADEKSDVPVDADVQNTDAYDRYRYQDKEISSAPETTVSEKVEELTGETGQLESDVVQSISTDLDVSEEAVKDAMETLGLTVFDLQNPQNLAELVKTVTGETEDVGILLDADFKQVISDVSMLVQNFADANAFDSQELSDFAAAYANRQTAGETVSSEIDQPAEMDGVNSSPEPTAVLQSDVEADGFFEEQAKAGDQEVSGQDASVVVEDRRNQPVNVKQKETAAGGRTQNGEPSEKEEAVTERSTVWDDGRNTSFSSGKQESQDFSQHLAASVNEQLSDVAEAESPAEVPEYTVVDAQDIIDQIVEQTKLVFDTDTTSIEMQLNPENLGRIFLNISSKEGSVSAQLFAQNEAVRSALESQVAMLTENLNQAGVKVDAIEVSVAAHEFERNLEQNAKGDEEQGRREEEKRSSRRSLRLDTLEDLSGLMSEEETLVARMMKDNGNSVDFTA